MGGAGVEKVLGFQNVIIQVMSSGGGRDKNLFPEQGLIQNPFTSFTSNFPTATNDTIVQFVYSHIL